MSKQVVIVNVRFISSIHVAFIHVWILLSLQRFLALNLSCVVFSFVTFMKPGVEPCGDFAKLKPMSMKLEFPGLWQGSISTVLHPIILQSSSPV